MTKKKTEDDVQSVEVDLVRIVDRLRGMKLGRYACVMHDGSTVKIEIRNKPRKPEPKLAIEALALGTSDTSPWDEKITAWLKKTKAKEVTIAQIFDKALSLDDAREHTPARMARVVQCLRDLGWTRRFLRGNSVWGPARPC